MKDAMTQMMTDTLMTVIWHRGRPKELLHHSDQGSQYTKEPFQQLMKDNSVTGSMSRSGNVWDNAATERFFSTLKIERVYNPTRRHSTIGYLSPSNTSRER